MTVETVLVSWNRELYEKYHNIFPIDVYMTVSTVERHNTESTSYVTWTKTAVTEEKLDMSEYTIFEDELVIANTLHFPVSSIIMKIPYELYSIFCDELDMFGISDARLWMG